jgi:hypothetical protein
MNSLGPLSDAIRGCCADFLRAFQSGTPLAIEDCLPPRDAAGYQVTLEHLVCLDLLHRQPDWGERLTQGSVSLPDLQSALNAYLERFPELESSAVQERLPAAL